MAWQDAAAENQGVRMRGSPDSLGLARRGCLVEATAAAAPWDGQFLDLGPSSASWTRCPLRIQRPISPAGGVIGSIEA